MTAPVIVAIDGPSGVGKSTAARRLALRLGVPFLDTGAMYRAVALKCLEADVHPDDGRAVGELLDGLDLALVPSREGGAAVFLDGRDVAGEIRSPAVSDASSRVSAHSVVRRRMVALQQDYARRHGGVVEGRDIGTRVFPDTPHKFFLDADPDVRHRRRFDQLTAAGREVSIAAVVDEIDSRDHRDAHREDSPLQCDDSYHVVDTTGLSIDEVVDEMAAQIASAGP